VTATFGLLGIIAYERLMKSGYYWATSLDAVHTSQIDCN
jgi:hypothetical protein